MLKIQVERPILRVEQFLNPTERHSMNRDTEAKATSRTHSGHLVNALEHAQTLTETRPDGAYEARWSHSAAHVGDLSVLALALRK